MNECNSYVCVCVCTQPPVPLSSEAQFQESLSSPFSDVFRNVSGQGGSISGAVSILAGSTIGAGG